MGEGSTEAEMRRVWIVAAAMVGFVALAVAAEEPSGRRRRSADDADYAAGKRNQ